MDWRVDFLPCKAKIRRHPDGWQGFLTQSGRKIRRQDMRGGDIKQALKKFLVDGGYSGERFANQVKDICGAQVEVVKRSELHKFVVLPRRWVVERLFGWLDKFRRLWKNCERELFISAQILNFALIAILIRRF